MTHQQLKEEIAKLEAKKNGDLIHDAEIVDQIDAIERQFNGNVKPEHSPIECIGCGS